MDMVMVMIGEKGVPRGGAMGREQWEYKADKARRCSRSTRPLRAGIAQHSSSIRSVAEALRSHPRRSQRVLEVYSPFILKLVRKLVTCTSTNSSPPTNSSDGTDGGETPRVGAVGRVSRSNEKRTPSALTSIIRLEKTEGEPEERY